MDSISNFYSDALDKHSRVMRLRYLEIQKTAEKLESHFIKRFGEDSFEIFQSDERLDSAISSYFFEIYRYKHFHGMLDEGKESKVNFPKIYAFTIKWIMKEKPYYVEVNTSKLNLDEGSKDHKDFSFFVDRVNEYICLQWLSISHFKHANKKIPFEKDEVKRLIYNLKFRDPSPGMLEMYLFNKVDHETLKRA